MTTTENMAEPTNCFSCDVVFDVAAADYYCPSGYGLCEDCFHDHQRTCRDCGE